MNFVKLFPPSVAMKMPSATAVEEKTPMIVSADCRERLRTNENNSANAAARATAQTVGCSEPHRTPMAMPVKPECPSASEKKLIRPVTIMVESRPNSGARMQTASSAFFMNVMRRNSRCVASHSAYQMLISHLPDGMPARIRPSSGPPAAFPCREFSRAAERPGRRSARASKNRGSS